MVILTPNIYKMGPYFLMSRLIEFFRLGYRTGEVFELKLVNIRAFSIN